VVWSDDHRTNHPVTDFPAPDFPARSFFQALRPHAGKDIYDFRLFRTPPRLVQALNARHLDDAPARADGGPARAHGREIGHAGLRTGSGKTLAYLLPILAGIDTGSQHVQAVVLAPTHELAMQITRVATDLAREAGLGVRVQALIGGAAAGRQIEGLKKKPHLVIGSAGRMTHLMELGKLKLKETLWLVLDEADRLLIEEGLEHIRKITGQLGPQTRFVFVSATEGPATTRIARGLAPNLEFVRTQDTSAPKSGTAIWSARSGTRSTGCARCCAALRPSAPWSSCTGGPAPNAWPSAWNTTELSVADLHGAHDKFSRQAALDDFRKGKAQTLIASDIAARGLDITGVELVVNLDVPSQSRDYLHRAGRTGRAGAAGLVLS
jgi:superfamily II DNA/RNA helicase